VHRFPLKELTVEKKLMNGKGGNIWLAASEERTSFLVQHFELLHPTKCYNKAKVRNGDKQILRLPLPD